MNSTRVASFLIMYIKECPHLSLEAKQYVIVVIILIIIIFYHKVNSKFFIFIISARKQKYKYLPKKKKKNHGVLTSHIDVTFYIQGRENQTTD